MSLETEHYYFYFGLIEKYIGSRLDLENLDFEFSFFPRFCLRIGAKLAIRDGFFGSDLQAYRYANLADKSTQKVPL